MEWTACKLECCTPHAQKHHVSMYYVYTCMCKMLQRNNIAEPHRFALSVSEDKEAGLHVIGCVFVSELEYSHRIGSYVSVIMYSVFICAYIRMYVHTDVHMCVTTWKLRKLQFPRGGRPLLMYKCTCRSTHPNTVSLECRWCRIIIIDGRTLRDVL
jgi:hypothetical protein